MVFTFVDDLFLLLLLLAALTSLRYLWLILLFEKTGNPSLRIGEGAAGCDIVGRRVLGWKSFS